MSNERDMIPWDELHPGSLNAESLGEGNTIIVTISALRMEEVSEIGPGRKATGKKVRVPVMRFSDYGDWWVVNKTNKGLIGQCLGTDTKRWKGQKIALTCIKTGFFGGTLAIRVSGGEGMAEPVRTKVAVSQKRDIDWTLHPIRDAEPPTLPEALEAAGITEADLDAFRASMDKPPCSDLTEEFQAKLARWLAHDENAARVRAFVGESVGGEE